MKNIISYLNREFPVSFPFFVIGGLIVLLVALVAPAHGQTAFQTYADPNGKFTIDFPGTPAASKPVENKNGKQPFTESHLTVNDDFSYALLITDYATDQSNVDLESLAVGAARACGGGYIIEDRDLWEGHKAVVISLDCPENDTRGAMYAMIHAVVDGNRIYQAMSGITEVQAKASPNNATRAVGFLKSLHLKAAK